MNSFVRFQHRVFVIVIVTCEFDILILRILLLGVFNCCYFLLMYKNTVISFCVIYTDSSPLKDKNLSGFSQLLWGRLWLWFNYYGFSYSRQSSTVTKKCLRLSQTWTWHIYYYGYWSHFEKRPGLVLRLLRKNYLYKLTGLGWYFFCLEPASRLCDRHRHRWVHYIDTTEITVLRFVCYRLVFIQYSYYFDLFFSGQSLCLCKSSLSRLSALYLYYETYGCVYVIAKIVYWCTTILLFYYVFFKVTNSTMVK